MIDNIPGLKVEKTDDGLILFEQDDGGNVERVAIHPLHLRYMAEKTGLIATSDVQAAKTIATLERRLRLLRHRIDHLGNWLTNHSDRKHADLDYEVTYAVATADIAEEFCADIGGAEEAAN
jgi:hypothetical protein